SSISVSGARASAAFRSNNFSLNSSVKIFDGFANVHTLKQSKIGLEAQDAALEKMKNDISLNVVNAYLQVLFAKEQLKVAESQLSISENQVKRMDELVTAGAVAEGELLNAKSTMAADNQNLIVSRNSFVIA